MLKSSSECCWPFNFPSTGSRAFLRNSSHIYSMVTNFLWQTLHHSLVNAFKSAQTPLVWHLFLTAKSTTPSSSLSRAISCCSIPMMSMSDIDVSIPCSTNANVSISCAEVSINEDLSALSVLTHSHRTTQSVKGPQCHNDARLSSSDLTLSHESKGVWDLTPGTDPRLVNELFDLSCLIDCHQAGRRRGAESISFPLSLRPTQTKLPPERR